MVSPSGFAARIDARNHISRASYTPLAQTCRSLAPNLCATNVELCLRVSKSIGRTTRHRDSLDSKYNGSTQSWLCGRIIYGVLKGLDKVSKIFCISSLTMPRKKQGLRSYHHKTRNGCMQCKRRRVKVRFAYELRLYRTVFRPSSDLYIHHNI